MARIHITGNAGSGKSTLAAKLGRSLDLPVYGLDQIVWQPGWRKSPADWRKDREAELVARPSWIIDGVSRPVLDAADYVIFLDVSRATSLVRCARRNWKYLFRSRPGLPENCPEVLIIPRLIKIIWGFPVHVRPGILDALLDREGGHVVRDKAALERAVAEISGLRSPKAHRP
jgi:adenylate kinase family enzyme